VVASGQVIPKARIRIVAQVMGQVSQVLVDEGDDVDPEKPMIHLADDEAAAQVEEARAALEGAEAKGEQFRGVSARVAGEALRQARERLTKAKLIARREEELNQAKASTQEALDQAQSDVRLAQSQVDAALAQAKASSPKGSDSRAALALIEQSRAALKRAEARLALYHIEAPLHGRVLQRDVQPGDGVQVGTPLLTLASLDPPRVKVQVDEKYLSLIRQGQTAKVTADAYPGRTFEATVERLAPSINQERGALDVHLIVKDPPPFLRFDMNASVEIITNSAQDVLLLPSEAVQQAATGEPFVYAAEGGRVRKKNVTLGLGGDQIFEITTGLDPHDVILLPKEPLSEGARVRAQLKG
jgi:HlyD family secretion protein